MWVLIFLMFHYLQEASTKQGYILKQFNLWIVSFVGGGHKKVTPLASSPQVIRVVHRSPGIQ